MLFIVFTIVSISGVFLVACALCAGNVAARYVNQGAIQGIAEQGAVSLSFQNLNQFEADRTSGIWLTQGASQKAKQCG